MILNEFNTFQECKQAQEYDYSLLRARDYAEKTGISLEIVRDLSLHLDQSARHQYYIDNNINLTDDQKKIVHQINNYWFGTSKFSNYYKKDNKFYYCKYLQSDVLHTEIEVADFQGFISLDDEGNEIISEEE